MKISKIVGLFSFFLSISNLWIPEIFADSKPVTFVPVCQRSPSMKIFIEDLFQRNCARITEAALGTVSSISSGSFIGSLNSWQLTSLKAGDFTGFSKITELNLSNQVFTSIEANTFQGLASLQKLTIEASSIGDIETDAFAGLTALIQLNLSSNEIVTLKPGAFHGLSQVADLDLSTNLLIEIPSGAFDGLAKLARLSLKGNKIRYLEANSFQGLINVSSVIFPKIRSRIFSPNCSRHLRPSKLRTGTSY